MTAEPYVRRGQSHERTFQRDLTDPDEIRRETERIARELVGDLPEGRPVMTVTVKLRTASFFTSTHGAKLAEPTTDVDRITEAALGALARFEIERPVRLLGVRAEFTAPCRRAAPTTAGITSSPAAPAASTRSMSHVTMIVPAVSVASAEARCTAS